MNFDLNWQRLVLRELNQEYSHLNRFRHLKLKPASIQLFDSQTLWGEFKPLSRTLSISHKLVQTQPWQNVMGVLLHEMAHQFVFENHPDDFHQKPHGEQFQMACKKIGVPAPFTKAQVGFQNISLNWKDETGNTSEEKILDKVKKLLALASSSNKFEASLAMRKVQELYAQYNLDRIQQSHQSQFVHLVISNGKKRQPVWEKRILSILLEFFFVEIIITQQFNSLTCEKNQAFEIIGTRENVLMAEYVYYFLLRQINFFVDQNSSLSRFEKTSFRLGLLTGFSEKLSGAKISESSETATQVVQHALQKFKDDTVLKNYLKEIYPRLHFRKNASRVIDPDAFGIGKREGQKLILNKPIESFKKSGKFLLSKK